jgi:uncharacterized protein (DUF2267 family)
MAALAYGQLLQGVEMAAGLDRAAAERIVRATLATLAERLGRADFAALAAQLPDELRQAPDEAAASLRRSRPRSSCDGPPGEPGSTRRAPGCRAARCWPP